MFWQRWMENLLHVNKIKNVKITSLAVEFLTSKIYLSTYKAVSHTQASGYLKGYNKKTHVISLLKSVSLFRKALRVICSMHATKLNFTRRNRIKVQPTKRILFVGFPENKTIRKSFKDLFIFKNHFFISDQEWVKGILTNHFSLLEYKRDFLQNLAFKSDGDKQLFYQNFGGVLKLYTLPDLVMLYSHSHGELIFSEAKSLGIPIVSILDASNDPSEVDYPVFGNFTSIRASKFLFVLLKRVLHLSFRF